MTRVVDSFQRDLVFADARPVDADLAFLASSTAGVGEERQSLTIEGETAPVEGLLAPPSMLGAPLAVLCVCDRRSVVDRTPVAEEAINRIGTRVLNPKPQEADRDHNDSQGEGLRLPPGALVGRGRGGFRGLCSIHS